MKQFIVGLGILLVLGGIVLGGAYVLGNTASAEIVQAATEPAEMVVIPVTGSATAEPESTMEATQTVAPTATAEPKMVDYVLGSTIDLSSKAPVAMTLTLPDGKLMSTNWAGAVGYKETDDQKTIFAPSKGIIYSYLGDVLTTWAHSGTGVGGKPYFFATNLDFYIRKTAENKTVSMPEALVKADSLKGVAVYLCQAPSGSVAYLSDHDANSQCPGSEIEMEITAVAIVPHEKLAEYNLAITNINSWMSSNYPDAGFETLTKDNGWLIRFCIGRFSDQVDDGTPWYSYNAGVIGLKIKDGE